MRQSEQIDINEGWAVHIYGGDRRLLCSLHPSHIWLFLIGAILGGLVVASWARCEPTRLPTRVEPPSKQAPLSVD
jgi:hypothetical protein